MSTRRKLHARRGAEGEGNNSSNSNSATSAAFVWASDRTNSASSDAPPRSESSSRQQTYRAPQPDSNNHPELQAVNSSSVCIGKDASGGNNNQFKWISDYLEASEDEDTAHQQPQGVWSQVAGCALLNLHVHASMLHLPQIL